MTNFVLNLVKRGTGIGNSQLFEPVRPAIFPATFNNPVLMPGEEPWKQIDFKESNAQLIGQKNSENQFLQDEKPYSNQTIISSALDSDQTDNNEKSKSIESAPAGSTFIGNISEPRINKSSANMKQESQFLPEDDSVQKSNFHQRSEEKKKEEIIAQKNGIAPYDNKRGSYDFIDYKVQDSDRITRSDNELLESARTQDQGSDISIKTPIKIFQESLKARVLGQETAEEDLVQQRLINANKREIPNHLIQDLALIRPVSILEPFLSESPMAEPKGSGMDEQSVQIRIGAIEVRAINPPKNPSSPSISLPKGFDDYYLARNYSNQ